MKSCPFWTVTIPAPTVRPLAPGMHQKCEPSSAPLDQPGRRRNVVEAHNLLVSRRAEFVSLRAEDRLFRERPECRDQRLLD